MYSYEDRIRAVKFYINCGYNAAYTVRKLGYPDVTNIKHWYREYSQFNDLHQGRKKVSKYSDKEKRDAVDYYFSHECNALKTVRELGYPSRPLLVQWVKELYPEEGKKRCQSFKPHVRCSHEEKIQAVMESCKGNLNISQIAEIYGVTPAAVSTWRKKLLGERRTLKMADPSAEDKNIEQLLHDKAELEAKVKRLEQDVYKLQLERDVLEKAGEILKKEKGISLDKLSNREKAFLIDALRNKYKLNELLPALQLSKSSYYYQVQCIKREDKYKELRNHIKTLFVSNKERYGYRRIHCLLKRDGITVSEKIVRKIMKDEQLIVKTAKKRKYNSYKGEISPEVENIINRDFSAHKPNEKWLTDITEFHIPAGKIYLSPIIDCFDGMAVSWTIGTSPNAELANTMLGNAINTLNADEHPLVHSDRGCHYRWPEWIKIMDSAALTRSMSKKGCSPDNSACEGFFGHLKNEMFYNRNWNRITIDSFINELDEYMHWYNEKRIKMSLGGKSPLEYRRSLGILT
ncbi:MAG: IS3 family transposase [Lachnospiraceae bacterium]|nr:IS3 family transposase [Lachnospiraceae bacterium]